MTKHDFLHYYGRVNSIVTATPFSKAALLPVLVICTDNRSHWLTGRLVAVNAQQFGVVELFGPVTVAMTPVPAKLKPQVVLLII